MIKVYNKRQANYPDTAIYIGRPSKWGNPFKIGQNYQGRILTRNDSISAYRDWFLYSDEGVKLHSYLIELSNKDLVCWCSPLSCHGDLLLRIANDIRILTEPKYNDTHFRFIEEMAWM